MTDPKYTHIVHIVDRSGSMDEIVDGQSKAARATKGIREFNISQFASTPEGERLTLSLYQFDTLHDMVFNFVSAASDREVLNYKVWPRGGTALLDAVGFAVSRTGEDLAAMDEAARPGKVYVVISTDGLENSSNEYTLTRVKAMVTEQQDAYGWNFVFIGADIDAFAGGASIGVPQAASLGTAGLAVTSAYHSTGDAVTRSRGAGGQSVSYTDQERERAQGK